MSSIHDFVDVLLNEPGWVKKRIQRIADDIEQERPYASLREGPKDTPEKRFIIEQSTVQELLRSMESRGESEYSGLILPPPSGDPPDCIVFDRSGRPVAVEVTEFVSRKAIEKNLKIKRDPQKTQQDSIYRDWSLNEVVEKLNDIIRNKDGKTFKGGPYAKTILVIHTDEFRLLIDREGVYERDLPSQSFGPVKQIDEAHLLFSYEPGVGSPYIKLPLNRP